MSNCQSPALWWQATIQLRETFGGLRTAWNGCTDLEPTHTGGGPVRCLLGAAIPRSSTQVLVPSTSQPTIALNVLTRSEAPDLSAGAAVELGSQGY
jgi:hypothetical protein